MIEKSFGLCFYLKRRNSSQNNIRFVFMRITVDGACVSISTKRLWDVNRWKQSAGSAKGTKYDAKELNAYLDTLRVLVFEARRILSEKGKEITARAIKQFMVGDSESKKTVLQVFQEHNQKMETLAGNGYAYGTLQRFKTSLEHTKAFIRWKYGKEDLYLREIDYEFVSEYSYWFKAIKKCNVNTTGKYLGNFKKIIIEALKRKWMENDPFTGFKISRREVNRCFLSKEEIASIAQKEFSIGRLSLVKDLFLFSCYTGLAYVDVKGLEKNQVTKGHDGDLWIQTRRQKTNNIVRLPLLPAARIIYERYVNREDLAMKDYIFPVITNQKVNSYLKEIADVCNIQKVLTFHIARHTFATTITLSNGVPIETVSRMLGHKSLKQTQQYAKIIDLKIGSDMALLRDKLEG